MLFLLCPVKDLSLCGRVVRRGMRTESCTYASDHQAQFFNLRIFLNIICPGDSPAPVLGRGTDYGHSAPALGF